MNQLAQILLLAGIMSGRPVDLSGWVSVALENSPGLVVAQAGVEGAGATYSSVRSALLPQLSFNASAGHAWSSVEMEPYGVAETDAETYSANLTLSQELLGSGGATWLSVRASSLGREQAGLQYTEAVLSLQQAVARAYYGAVEAMELVGSAEASLSRSSTLLQRMELLYELGGARELELLEARMQESSDRLALLRNRQALTQSLTELRRAAGVSEDSSMTIDTSAVLRPLGRESILDLPDDYSENPGLQSAVLSEEKAGLDLSVSRRGYWPSLGASASWNWNDDRFEPGDAHLNDSWNVRASLSWSIFDGWLRESRVQSASASLLSAQASARSARDDISASVRAAHDALLSSVDGYELAELSLEYAGRRMDLSQLSYELGDLSVTDLLDAQAALSEAEAGLVTARVSCLVAEVDYRVLLGRSPRLGE